jgi:putative ABC transport system ATP-binding protein
MTELIRFERVARCYRLGNSETAALADLDLTIEAESFVVLCGPSGSGKSTLLNLAGLLDMPTHGEVWLDGMPTSRLADHRLAATRNRRIGFIFQHFNLVPVLSVLENTMLPLEIAGERRHHAARAAGDLLDALGLAEHRHKRPDRLSGGQRQRVAIARALVTQPSLVIADEPTANLDSATAQQIVDHMRALNRAQRVTFLMATHDEALIRGNATRVLRLRDGRVVADEVAS